MTSNFSFSYSVFKGLILQTCKNQGLFGKELIDVMLSFNDPETESLEKAKILVTSSFSFSHNVFSILSKTEIIMSVNHEFVICSNFQFGQGQNFVDWSIDCMVLKAAFKSISVISWWPVHLSMLSWSSFNQYYDILSKSLAALPHNHC